MSAVSLAFLALVALLATAAATGALRRLLFSRMILDYPVDRSSHQVPTPRGGGLAIYVTLVSTWGVIALRTPTPPDEIGWILLCSLGLAIPSWVDDLVGLPWAPRLIWQMTMASVGTMLLDGPQRVFQGLLPPAADMLVTGFLWVGFINLFNFADGIDGNAGTKATALGVGMFLLALLGEIPDVLGELGVAIAAVACGFLLWNWHPARIFMGEVGSVPLGFLLAWLLLSMATEGQWAPAIILPLVYLSDTGLTYLMKVVRRERFWHPHRDHFYQRAAARKEVSHAQVVKVILVGDVIMILMAVLAASGPAWPSLLGAGVAAGAVMAYLTLGFRNRPAL